MRRRQILAALGSLPLAGCSSLLAPSDGETRPLDGEPDGWTHAGGTAARTGRATDLGIDSPHVRWASATDGRGVAPPLAVGERVYAYAGRANEGDDFGDATVLALDRTTGEPTWTTPLDGAFSGCPPAIDGGRLFVGHAGRQSLYAVDARSGDELWNERGLGGSVNEALAAAEGVVAVPQQETLYGFGRHGDQRWTTVYGDQAFLSPLAVAEGVAYAGSIYTGDVAEDEDDRRSQLLALDHGTGQIRWSHARGENFHALVRDTEYGDALFATDKHGLLALGADRGTLRWRVPIPELNIGHLAAGPEQLYVAGGRAVRAYDRDDGQERWRFAIDESQGYLRTTPTVIDGAVVVVSENPQWSAPARVYALDAATGEERWRVELPGAVGTSVAALDALYVGVTGPERSHLVAIEDA